MKCDKLTPEEVYGYVRAAYDNHKPIYDAIVNSHTVDSAKRHAVLYKYYVKHCFPWIDLRQVTASIVSQVGHDMWTEAREGC